MDVCVCARVCVCVCAYIPAGERVKTAMGLCRAPCTSHTSSSAVLQLPGPHGLLSSARNLSSPEWEVKCMCVRINES